MSKSQTSDQKNKHVVVLTGSTFQGSGMNFFILNNALKWKEFGYKVTIICQDRNAKRLECVDSYIQDVFPQTTTPLQDGQLRVVVPFINGIVPVYASQQYCQFQGIMPKPIQEMTDQQIETNIKLTGNCLRKVIQNDKPFKIIANYLILSGTIAQRISKQYGIPYEVIIPGLSVLYRLKPNPHLYKWVLPVLKEVSTIYPMTRFVYDIFARVAKSDFSQFNLKDKLKLINPGMNTDKFIIRQDSLKCEEQFLQKVRAILQKQQNIPFRINQSIESKIQKINISFNENELEEIHRNLMKQNIKNQHTTLQKNLLQKWIPFNKEDEVVIYMGALINNKGVGELLAIAPKLIQQRPSLKFIFCGSGPYREHMIQLLRCFEEGDLQRAKKIVKLGDFITQINIEQHFVKITPEIRNRIIFVGLATDYDIESHILPLCDILVCPSRTQQICNMNIIEAMCCGVIPICNDHSWLTQVIEVIEKQYEELSELIRVEREFYYERLASTIMNTLDFVKNNNLSKIQVKNKVRQIAVKNYCWQQVAEALIFQK